MERETEKLLTACKAFGVSGSKRGPIHIAGMEAEARLRSDFRAGVLFALGITLICAAISFAIYIFIPQINHALHLYNIPVKFAVPSVKP